jgi:DNA-binding MarR family transcriptional regulator
MQSSTLWHVPRSYDQLDLDVQLCFPLYAATRAVTHRYAELLADADLTYPQYLTLMTLWGASGPMSVGDLGARLRLDSGTLTPLLKRLEAAGRVVRRRDSADERRVLVELTDEGWALRDRVAGVPNAMLGSLDLSAREAEQLRRLLGKVLTHLDAQ